MRPKVLFILRIPPPFGGGEIVSKLLYEKLACDGNFYFLLFSRKNHSKAKQSKNSISGFFYGFHYIFLSINSMIYHRPYYIYIGLPKGFLAFCRNSIIILVARLFRIKIIAELHGMSFSFDSNIYKKKVLIFILNKISKIRVLGKAIKEYFLSLGYSREIYIIPNGIDIPNEYFTLKKPNKLTTINFLYFGAISKPKGFFRVIDCLYALKENGLNNFSLNVIGEWVNSEEQRNFFQSKKYVNLKENIIFKGKLIEDEKWKAILNSHFMIHLSSFDGQPMTIIETMGLGIPTIASKVGAIPEMLDDGCGYLVDNDFDVIKLLTAILKYKVDYMEISAKVRNKYLHEYKLEKMVSEIKKMVLN